MPMIVSRRRFLKVAAALAAYGATGPLWVRLGSSGRTAPSPPARKLVVIFLAGGNDGLNTVIPYGVGTYYRQRPTIAIAQSRVLPLPGTSLIGLHPSLPTVQSLYRGGHVALVQGVGYDNPDLSHFGSTDVWMTASPTHATSAGWLGRWLDLTPDENAAVRAVAIGYSLPQLLVGARSAGAAIAGFGSFAFYDGHDNDPHSEAYRLHQAFLRCSQSGSAGDAMLQTVDTTDIRTVTAVRAVQALGDPSAPDPQTLADQMSLAITLLKSSLGTRIAYLTLGSFDDHYGENPNHDNLLSAVDGAIARFWGDVAKTPDPQNYLLLTFSEFGRRVEEDGSSGTDHGTAAPHFVIGPAVRGGLYGEQPGLDINHLDVNGNLVRAVELREVYATVIDRWLGGVTSQEVLGYTPASGLHPVPFL